MAEPKKKLTRSRRGWRRSHDALVGVNPRPCPKCKTPGLSHRVCNVCGTYKGRKIEPKTALISDIDRNNQS